MREHKYRAWHQRQMYFVAELEFDDTGVSMIALVNADGEYTYEGNTGLPFELLQYTGLKDCKGTEIFEEDIVKSGETIIGVMVFEAGCFVLKGVSFYSIREEHLEIIGNIYEHPELLEERKHE